MILSDWLTRWPGRLLLEAEQRELDRILPDLFGFHLLQLGAIDGCDLSAASRIRHRVVLDCGDVTVAGARAGIGVSGSGVGLCDAEYLPVANDAIDVLLLPHALEFTPDPQHVLREGERVLVSGGHVVITGFNPLSLAGLCRWPLSLGRRPPWNGRFLSLWRLCEWLELLGFEVLEARCLLHRPPIGRLTGGRHLRWLNRLGQWLLLAFGCNYVVLARKSAGAIIPLQGRLRQRAPLLPVVQASPGSPRAGWSARPAPQASSPT